MLVSAIGLVHTPESHLRGCDSNSNDRRDI